MTHCLDSAACHPVCPQTVGQDAWAAMYGHRFVLLDSKLLNLNLQMARQLGIAEPSRCKGGNPSKKKSTTKRSSLADESCLKT